jgi:hypothetical protein
MSVSVTNVISNALTEVYEPADGTGLVSRTTCLRYYSAARRNLNKYVNIVKGNDRVTGVVGQYLYDLPSDYKSNLFRVEYNFQPLAKVSLAALDEYDEYWRDSANRNPPDSEPKFFVEDTGISGKFIVYPTPSTAGESIDLTGNGFPESITLYGETVTFDGLGLPESFSIAGETFHTSGPGVPESFTTKKYNLNLFYDKHFTSLSAEEGNNLDVDLEPYEEDILNYILMNIYTSAAKYDERLISRYTSLYGAALEQLIRDKNAKRPPMAFTVKRADGYRWGRRGLE